MDVPKDFEDLFDDASRALLVLATMREAAEPVVAPVWFVSDESGLLFSSDHTAAKVRDIRARPQVGGVVMAEGDHLRYVSVRGDVVEVVDPGAEGIDVQAVYRRIVRRYEGRDPAQPFDGVLFWLVPRRTTGYDYHELSA